MQRCIYHLLKKVVVVVDGRQTKRRTVTSQTQVQFQSLVCGSLGKAVVYAPQDHWFDF